MQYVDSQWNEECQYSVSDMDLQVWFRVLDADVGKDDVVGEGTCTL